MSGEGKIVCVTGASGFIASWLVKLLLHRGYTVNATVRHLDDPKKVDHLVALEGAKERLHLFKAELLEEGSFDDAIKDCVGVFHTASPCFLDCDENQVKEKLVDPAVKGTINVLNSCTKAPSLRRVVLTSSIAAMLINDNPISPHTQVDETWWSDFQFCNKEKKWYAISKLLAEEAAWKFAKEKDIDLVTICPGWTLGPLLQPVVNGSSFSIYDLIGAKTYPDDAYPFVHVRDIANAHIQAFEISSASGRYALVESCVHFHDVVKILQHSYPTLQLPNNSFAQELSLSTGCLLNAEQASPVCASLPRPFSSSIRSFNQGHYSSALGLGPIAQPLSIASDKIDSPLPPFFRTRELLHIHLCCPLLLNALELVSQSFCYQQEMHWINTI